MNKKQSPNFSFLKQHESLLLQLATTAEQAFIADPNTTLLKLRQLGEATAQDIASSLGIQLEERTSQHELLRKIRDEVELDREEVETCHAIRVVGNEVNHEFISKDPNDEPASELMASIQKEREAAATFAEAAKKATSKPRIKKAAVV
ncbi:DUF4145 domain-containing protein [Microbulbifer zhoushanensis]|uniref:DUF4145 domain-containing protein n=1 Tax=Microbulbifer TaxID=48073 RepID=UPI001F1C468B|nr:DUF4145 domain-containing protein [Microbulbifer zhoushanensis]